MSISEQKTRFETWRTNRSRHPSSRHYLDAYICNVNQSPMLREARAIEAWWGNMPLEGWPDEELAGMIIHNEPVYFSYGRGQRLDESRISELRELGDKTIDADVELVHQHAYRRADPEVYTAAQLSSIESGAAASTWFGGHMVPDFERILEIGLDGYAYDIEKYRTLHAGNDDFYDALSIVLRAIQNLILRYAAMASGEMAKRLNHIAHNCPRTFHEALQLVWILHTLNNADSYGCLDRYLHPFFEADINAGRLTYERAAELICELYLKTEADGAIQNLTIGGTDGTGKDFYTPLTRILIDMARELGYKGPNLCLRVTKTMPQDIWDSALACIATGIGLPVLYNDDVYINALVRHGIPLETARGYCLAGCSQVMIPGMSNFINDIGIYNAAKVAELTMYGGFDPRTNTQVGPHTKPAVECTGFEELMAQFWIQSAYFIETEVAIHNLEAPFRHSREGYVMRTLFTRDCISTGKNVFDGGARYNNIELEIIGITNAADHLYAIKHAVFDNEICTMAELADALKHNWAGHEALRQYVKNKAPKFGNDNSELDALRGEIADFLFRRFNESPAVLGGVFVPGEVIFVAHEYCGVVTGATADGRYAYSVLADSAGASQGNDKAGPTALMNSVLKIPAREYLLTSVVLNIRFLPDTFLRAQAKAQMLFVSFFEQGGMQVQINVCDSKTLQKAQQHPEEYENLVVRVGGYSDYFTRLSRSLQDEIIMRTAYDM